MTPDDIIQAMKNGNERFRRGHTWTGTSTGEEKPHPITLTLEQKRCRRHGRDANCRRPDVCPGRAWTFRGEVLDLSLATAAQSGGELWVQLDNMVVA